MSDIFMSYSEADRPLARVVALELQARGAALRSHSLDECEHFLLVYSPRAAADPQIKAEIVAALVQNKPIAVLTVEPSPLTLPDFPFLLDATTTHFTLTTPAQAEDTVNAMAAHYGLPQRPMIPPDAAVFDFGAPVDLESVDGNADLLRSHASGIEFPDTADALDKTLFHVSELGENRAGTALTLLLWLPRFAAEYTSGLRGYRDQRMALLRARWLQQLEEQSKTALKAGDEAQIETLAETARIADPQHPLSRQLQSALRERRMAALWQQVAAQAAAHGWNSTSEMLELMRTISPLDKRTLQAADRYRNEIDCAAVYEVAARAAAAGQSRAFAHLIQYIQQRCPDFEDRRNLLSILRITPELFDHLKPKHTLRESGGVQVLAFSPDSTLLVSGGTDGILRLWDIEQAQQVVRQRRDDGTILSLAYSYDGTLLVSTSAAGVVRLWQMPEGREVMTIDQFDDAVTCACFTPDDHALICGGSRGRIQIVRIEDGLVLWDGTAHDYAVTSIVLSPPMGDEPHSHRLLLTASEDKRVKVWRYEDRPTLTGPTLTAAHSLNQHSMIVQEAAFSASEPLIAASVGNDGRLCLWSPLTGELLMSTRSETTQIRAAAFAPGQSLLATGGTDRSVNLWDADTRQNLRQLTGHGASVNALAFSSNGLWLASGSSDHTIILWHL